MIVRENCLKNIADSLAFLEKVIELRNEESFHDLNIAAETFYADLINLFQGWKLVNANNIQKNIPGIDLIDVENKIAIQVTSDNSREKITHTIEEFISNQLYKKCDRLIILHIKGSKTYHKPFDTEGKFKFNAEDDVWNSNTLIRLANQLDTSKLKQICDFLKNEVDRRSFSKVTEASEVETIIDLIEFITQNRQIKYHTVNSIVDPDYKINKRFKEFANNLTTQYLSLVSVYETPMEAVEKEIGSDDAQEIITVIYLQDISIKFLDECQNNPVKALDKLVDFFETKLQKNMKRYDRAAIKFYLIREMIKCNVFPNEVKDEN